MAANLVFKRSKHLGFFSQRFIAKTFCVASEIPAAESPATESPADNASQDVKHQKKKGKKKKDLAKMAAYEVYRNNFKIINETYKEEYERMKIKEGRRMDEINQGSFSPLEQHKKAVEDIRKYNENKEKARETKDEEKVKRRQVYYERKKEASDAKILKRNRKVVLKMIEESKSFVTFDNLEEKIQEVLSKETSYNFAIKTNGSKLLSTEPPSNLGMQGPGPIAYQGQRLYNKDRQESWKTRRKLPEANVGRLPRELED